MKLRGFIPILLLVVLCFQKNQAQDTLVFENEWRFPVVVEEERERDVIYRRADLPHSPAYIMEKRFISTIQYKDPVAGRLKFKPSPDNGKTLGVRIVKLDNGSTIRGLLLNMNDTALFVRKRAGGILEGSGGAKTDLIHVFPYQNISKVEVRRRDKMRKYALLGAVTGLVAGTLTGWYMYEDSPPCDPTNIDGRPCDENLFSPQTKLEKSLLLGIGSAGGGWIAGSIVGSVRIRFNIGGKKDIYNLTIPKLRRLMNWQR